VLFAGVGGQGVLTAARLLGEAALSAGLEARVGALHGMAQRGGSVEATVVIGPGYSSFIARGAADVAVGLEPIELCRARPKLSPRTVALVSLGRVPPYTLALQGKPYPDLECLLASLRSSVERLVEIDAATLARQAGSARTLNVVMLGALGALGVLPFDSASLWRAIERRTAARLVEVSRRAFDLGCAGP
ncbi:MAG: indolepyruvate oxidoreductase subunit beta, partial [Deltaproteobacteria bacterium]|nr:indolepyruvate oxidoreductase subunit beta [Deltaproteobacteria bacterium]